MTNDERMQRESNLIATIRKELPEFAKACADDTELVLLHQDAFAADYQENEYKLLGMAIEYAGLRGKEVRVIGENRSSLGEDDRIHRRLLWKRELQNFPVLAADPRRQYRPPPAELQIAQARLADRWRGGTGSQPEWADCLRSCLCCSLVSEFAQDNERTAAGQSGAESSSSLGTF
jgi:hypothetical protein